MSDYTKSAARPVYTTKLVPVGTHPDPLPVWGEEITPWESAALRGAKKEHGAPAGGVLRDPRGARVANLARWYAVTEMISATERHGIITAEFPDGFAATLPNRNWPGWEEASRLAGVETVPLT